MKTKSLLFLFGLAVLLQLAVPAAMILKREHALTHGQAFKFRTAPVDPYDAFRGRFVALGFDQSRVRVAPDHDFLRNETVHALLAEDAEGYAFFSRISRARPLAEPYLDLKIQNVLGGDVDLRLPFDRFYMEETEAADAERAYRQNSVRSNRNAYVQVRIEKGFGVIEDLFVEDTPIRDYIARQLKEYRP
jgi:uncharacterized membrane-anchored protein